MKCSPFIKKKCYSKYKPSFQKEERRTLNIHVLISEFTDLDVIICSIITEYFNLNIPESELHNYILKNTVYNTVDLSYNNLMNCDLTCCTLFSCDFNHSIFAN